MQKMLSTFLHCLSFARFLALWHIPAELRGVTFSETDLNIGPDQWLQDLGVRMGAGRLRIDELVDRLYKNFKERFVVGEVVVGVHEASPCMCRILKILEDEKDGSHQYEVAWLDDDNRRIGTSKESADNLKRKKVPFSRALLKAFVRESASSGPSRNSPWSVHDKHARKYKIALVAPEQIKPKETPSKRTPPSERGQRNEVSDLDSFLAMH
jgi:hypothetical protein